MSENSKFKRVALVVNALSGSELKAGKSDSARAYGVLVDPSCGACDPGHARLIQDCPDRYVFNEELLGILKEWSPGDQLILYFSGHGEERKALYHLCFGAEKKTYFPFKNILTELESAGVTRAIIILDACQSGAALRKAEKSSPQVPSIRADDIPKGMAIVASSRANEYSHEKDDQTQSVFTGLFCDAITSGLSGSPTPDGKISVSDLVSWVNTTLESDSKLASFSQTSTYAIDGGAEHPVWIALNKSGRTEPATANDQSKSENNRGTQPQTDFDNWLTGERDFSAEVVRSFRERLRPDVRESTLPDSLDDLSFLANANLLSAGRLYATGVLLFSEQPEKLIPRAYVQCFEFTGTTRSAPQDQKEFYGPLMRQLEGAMTFIENRIEKVEITEQGALAAKFEFQYPMVCIRELLANALCHRDYLDGTHHTHVRVFQDRIEIVSPGLWGSKLIEDSKEMDLATLESESATRNERLATALRRIRLVETGGSGIPSALSDCEERGAKPPTALSRDGTVKVTIYPRANWSKTNFDRRGTQAPRGPKRFRVALAFAAEKRDYVARVASLLAQRFGESAILYDKFHEAEFARSDLGMYLPALYERDSDLLVVVVSRDFEKKQWTGLELTAIYDLLKKRKDNAVMLTRFDHAEIPGLFDAAGFIELDERTPDQAAAFILERLALNEGKPKEFYTGAASTSRLAGSTIPNNLPRVQTFFGRQQELARIAEALGPNARGWGALIDGPGGIGKTSLAIRAAEMVPNDRFRRIIFVSSKERELTADGQRALGNFILPSYLEMLDAIARELDQPDLAKSTEHERPALVLRALREADVLLVLDNLETLPEPDRDQLFGFLNRLPHGSGAIVTSRRRSDVSAVNVRLDRLDWEAASALLAELARDFPQLGQASDAERRALYEETGGNPLLIRWVVGQLGRGRGRTVSAALQLLRNAPTGHSALEFILGDLLDTFTPSEEKVLAALTHFTVPIDVKLIPELSGVTEVAAQIALGDLTTRGLVMPDAEERRFALVPMVAEFLRRERSKGVAQTGNRLERHAYALIVKNGYQQHDRFPVLDEAWPTLAAALPLFIAGPNEQLQTVCDALSIFLNFTGRWDELLSLSQQAEAKAESSRDYDNAGWRAYEAGTIHYRRQQAEDVLACADRAAAYWDEAQAGARERSSAIRLQGIGHALNKDFSAAIVAFRKVLDLRRTLSAEDPGIVIALNDLADAQRASGDLAAAERDYREALNLARKVGDAEGEAYITGNRVTLALDRGDWPTAESLAHEALYLAERVGRLELIAGDCHRLAQALVRQGKSNEALPYARRAVDIFTQLGLASEIEAARKTLKECED